MGRICDDLQSAEVRLETAGMTLFLTLFDPKTHLPPLSEGELQSLILDLNSSMNINEKAMKNYDRGKICLAKST